MDFILGYFGNKVSEAQKNYHKFVTAIPGQEYKSPVDDRTNSAILGSVNFIEDIKDKYLKDKKGDRNLSELRAFSTRPEIQEIEKEVESVFGPDNALSKKVKLYFCHRYSGKKLREIGTYFGIGESGVSQSSRRVSLKISADIKLRKQILQIESRLELSRV